MMGSLAVMTGLVMGSLASFGYMFLVEKLGLFIDVLVNNFPKF